MKLKICYTALVEVESMKDLSEYLTGESYSSDEENLENLRDQCSTIDELTGLLVSGPLVEEKSNIEITSLTSEAAEALFKELP